MRKFNRENALKRLELKRKWKNYSKYFYIGIPCLLCCILSIYFAYSKFSTSKEEDVVQTKVGDFIYGDVIIGAYIDGKYSNTIPSKDDGYFVESVSCDNGTTGEWNNDAWGLFTTNLTKRTKCNVYFLSKAKLTVKADSLSKIYGDSDPELTYSVYKESDKVDITLDYINCSRIAGENVGTYLVTCSENDEKNTNYDISFQTGNLTIDKKTLNKSNTTVEVLQDTFEFDGQNHTLTLKKVTVDGLNVPLEDFEETLCSQTEVGSTVCIWNVKVDSNFSGSITHDLTVTQAVAPSPDPQPDSSLSSS